MSPYNSSNNKRSTQKKTLRSKRMMNSKEMEMTATRKRKILPGFNHHKLVYIKKKPSAMHPSQKPRQPTTVLYNLKNNPMKADDISDCEFLTSMGDGPKSPTPKLAFLNSGRKDSR